MHDDGGLLPLNYLVPFPGFSPSWCDHCVHDVFDPIFSLVHPDNQRRVDFEFADWKAQIAFFDREIAFINKTLTVCLKRIPTPVAELLESRLSRSLAAMKAHVSEISYQLFQRQQWMDADYWSFVLFANTFAMKRATQLAADDTYFHLFADEQDDPPEQCFLSSDSDIVDTDVEDND